jgi:hypothetical protein
MRWGGAVTQGSGHPHELVPLLADQPDIDGSPAEERVHGAEGGGAVQAVELLILEVLQPRHEREAEQVAEAEQLLGEAVRVGVVLAGPQDRVVLEQAVEHVDGLSR